MTLDEVVRDLGSGSRRLPRESMKWALDHWDEAGPRFIAILDGYSGGADRREETAGVLLFAIHLFGETADAAAYPALCRLLHDAEAAEIVLGDAITETLGGILIRVFDGDRAPLQSVIEDAAADGFVREAALKALAYMAYEQRISESEMRSYLLHLLEVLPPETDEMLWVGWADVVANLGYQDFEPQVAELFERGLIDPGITDFEWFQKDLRRTLDDPRRLAGFEADQVVPLVDAIGVLEGWHGFSEHAVGDDPPDYDAAEPWMTGIEEPYVNPFRHVGRNDPCPCGSGKKFKKCCLPGRA